MTRAADGVYALRYAYRTESFRGEHFHGYSKDCHDLWPIDYYTWVIVKGGVPYLFDAGFTPEEAERRGARHYLGSPLELLAQLGFSPDEVPVLVLSHLHYDHTGYIDAFPCARVLVQRREVEFWEGPYAMRGAYKHLRPDEDMRTLRQLIDRGQVELLGGDAEVIPGVTVHLLGGHTAGTQVVKVATARGPIVLASDASHFYANVEEDRPYGAVHQLDLMYAAFDALRELAGDRGVIVPGHDPRVPERHRPWEDPRITEILVP